ncbi:MAG: DUF177 domain-containing protein [Thermoflavifilum sp.]|nr:DUF177 domain-containing protein [Thermoflavifilum sp.]
MRAEREYDIAFVGLKNGTHHYQYHITDDFFAHHQVQTEFSDSQIDVGLEFEKNDHLFLLKFSITGDVTISCDRCGEPFRLALWEEFDQVVKLVDHPEWMEDDEEPEVHYLSRTESILNVANWIHEFILLSIPMQHIHPDRENGESGCNPVVIQKLDEMRRRAETDTHSAFWDELYKKFPHS